MARTLNRGMTGDDVSDLQAALNYHLRPPKPPHTPNGPPSAHSDDVGRAFRSMSAACSDRSRPAVPIDVGRGGGAPAGWR